MMNITMKLMVLTLLAITIATAKNNDNNEIIIGEDVPNKAMLYPKLEKDRVELDTVHNFDKYKETQERRDDRKKILSGVFDAQISLTPEIRGLRSIDSIKISPLFVTTIILPEDMVITDAQPSFKTRKLEAGENLIRFQPKDKDFYIGNIPIAFSDGKKNYYMVIYVERYFQSGKKEDYSEKRKKHNFSIAKKISSTKADSLDALMGEHYGKYNTEEKLFTIFKYVLPRALSDEEAIIIYEKMTGKKGIKIEDGDYVSFIYDNITYKIIRNDKQGALHYENRAYNIENSTMR